ncbi:hypothetical protein [Laspinema palackyanum]|uniref:hypothetical protein n=1 Tax=Laspinema palackyanum TaxID=3231601 RepID=UPI00345D41CD|nr:hypothetical protein [Laspinema sp. D2c]
MAELTIQVPDEWAKRLQPLQHRLPELLQRLVESIPNSATTEMLPTVANPTASPVVYVEVLDFLISGPTPGEIAAFKVSGDAQARLGELLEKNREGRLNETESAELDLSEQLDRLMTLLKAKAYAESIK